MRAPSITDLRNVISKHIQSANGKLPFDQFMQMALYEPDVGYYTGPLDKFGEVGDFITSPEISPLWAKVLARYMAQLINESSLAQWSMAEFGAGSGVFIVDVLKALNALQQLPDQYYVIEISPTLIQRQRTYAQQHLSDELVSRIQWVRELPKAFDGVVFANEVLDAMPVKLFEYSDEGLKEGLVVQENPGEFSLQYHQPSKELLKAFEALTAKVDIDSWQLPYRSEININGQFWLKEQLSRIRNGWFIGVDYGFTRDVYYHPGRSMGTLMCHYQHTANTDPLMNIGEQDVTAHVDFSVLIEIANEQGWEVEGFGDQGSFLLANGLLECMSADGSAESLWAQSQAVKRLTLPSEMGELFKVLVLSKRISQ